MEKGARREGLRGPEAVLREPAARLVGIAVRASANMPPSSKNPPKATWPAPRSSMRANWAMDRSRVGPSTIVTRRDPSRTTGGISHGSTNWAKLRGA